MDSIVKIRNKETGLFKVKRPINGARHGWSTGGDYYKYSTGKAALKTIIKQDPSLAGKIELIIFDIHERTEETDDSRRQQLITAAQTAASMSIGFAIRGDVLKAKIHATTFTNCILALDEQEL